MRLTIPITKVDEEQRKVYGRMCEQRVDKTNREVWDFDRGWPLVKEWSDDVLTRTQVAGQEPSYGNVRAMHDTVFAGKLSAIAPDHANKAVEVCVDVLDNDQWRIVKAGGYTGLSIGGEYAERWPDPDNKDVVRYAARINEVSLVDNPAMYGCTFEAVKGVGSTELRKFVGVAATTPEQVGGGLGRLLRSLTPVSLTSLLKVAAFRGGASDPVVDVTTIRGTFNSLTQSGVYPEPGAAAKVLKGVVGAWRRSLPTSPDTASESTKKMLEGAGLVKCWGSVASLASTLQSLEWTLESLEYERPDSPAFAQVKTAAQVLAAAVVALADEAASESTTETEPMTMTTPKPEVTKADDTGTVTDTAPATTVEVVDDAAPVSTDTTKPVEPETPAAATDTKPVEVTPTAVEQAAKAIVDAILKLIPSVTAGIPAPAPTPEPATKASDTTPKTSPTKAADPNVGAVTKAVQADLASLKAEIATLTKQVARITSLPAPAGTPIGPVSKTTPIGGTAPVVPTVESIEAFIAESVSKGLSPQAAGELRLFFASQLMPR